MASTTLFRLATRSVRPARSFVRASSYAPRSIRVTPSSFAIANNFSTSAKLRSGHEEETYEEFSARYAFPLSRDGRQVRVENWWCWKFDIMPYPWTPVTPTNNHIALFTYEKEFDAVQDVFELQRNLNNAFAYDLVPSVEVLSAALRAARRVNDFPTAVRVFEGIRAKVENEGQYKQYLEALEGLRTELGVPLQEELYPKNE
ncbi:Cytochrome c oxidase subunit 6 [Talaromyces pinophilus]|nr:Cytochrome c oxidase subunit 6 [Talaromyces pinophilus]